MQAPEGGAGGAEGAEDGQDGRRRAPQLPGGPASQHGAGVAQGFSIQHSGNGGTSRVLLLRNFGGSGGEAFLESRSLGAQLEEMTLRVPFRSPGDADLVRRQLPPFEEHPNVQRNIAVNGSFVVVTWTSDDHGRLWTAFFSFSDHIIAHMQNVGRSGRRFATVSVMRNEP